MYQKAILVNLLNTEFLDIEFSNIKYAVPVGFRKPKKQILKGIDGCFKSGELTAIMGPSGAGKTTLLNILTGFQKTNVTGNLNFRSRQGNCDWNHYKKETCYIQQDDMLPALFTVDEIITMACNLKLGNNLNHKSKKLIIDNVLDILDLNKMKNTRCNKLSGGQRKRLSIALELLDNPPVMFLDEPTTGLDSSVSRQCVAMLQNLARAGRTVICTIHQPNATIYEMFDHVYLLAEGCCVYQGDTKNTVKFLKKFGFHCPKYHNPADYVIEVISKEYGDFNNTLSSAATDTSWRAITPIKGILCLSENNINSSIVGKTTVLKTKPSELTRFWILLNRSLLQLFRDRTNTHLKFVSHIFVGTILGLLYSDIGSNGLKAVNNLSFVIVCSVYLSYTSMMPAVLKFPSELEIIRKEQFNNWYKLRTYYIANLILNLIVQVFFVIIYSTIAYFLSNQPPNMSRYLMFLIVSILICLVSESLGLALGATVNPVNGTFIGAIITAIYFTFAGILVFFSHMPRFMYYITYISYLRYAVEAMILAIYGFNRPHLPCPVTELTYCHFRIPKVLLKEIAMLDVNYTLNITVLIVYFVILRYLAYQMLKKNISVV